MKVKRLVLDPETTIAKSELVVKRIPLHVTTPDVKVALPVILMLAVVPSPIQAARLTPAFNVRSSVYEPERMKTVSPLVAAVIAACIVVCVPLAALELTINLAGP